MFGTAGVAIAFGPQDGSSALIRQPDGKLVVAGTSSGDGFANILLARYWPDGRVDTSFGDAGKVTSRFGSGSSAAALVQQPDGKLVVAGSVTVGFVSNGTLAVTDVLLVRYWPDGSLDTSFGTAGIVMMDLGASEAGEALILQPDGTFVVAGIYGSPGSGSSPFALGTSFLMRYTPEGSLDVAFGHGGRVTDFFPTGQGMTGGVSLARQSNGKIVVAALAPTLSVARFEPNGRLDVEFGNGGTVSTSVGGVPPATTSLLCQPDGKVVVAAPKLDPASGIGFVVTRFMSDGRLDDTFGTDGTTTSGVAGQLSGHLSIVLQPDGKLVVAFHAEPGTSETLGPVSALLLTRFQPDGRLDTGFGSGGTATATIGGTNVPHSLLLQPDGKFVVAGTSSPSFPATRNATFSILLARYQTLGCPAVDPEPCLAQLAAFVTDAYLVAYARMPTSGEVAYWVNVLQTDPIPDKARAMLQLVFASPEFRQRPLNPWQYVLTLYQAVLGREPAPQELDWWVQALLDRFNMALPGFIGSLEFQRLVPDCRDQAAVTMLIGRLYQQVLKRVPSLEEVAWWTTDVVTWCALEETVRVFFNSGEYLGPPRSLADHVTVLYQALLARGPDAWELVWWMDYLAGQQAILEADMMASEEFVSRFYRLFP